MFDLLELLYLRILCLEFLYLRILVEIRLSSNMQQLRTIWEVGNSLNLTEGEDLMHSINYLLKLK